MNREERTKAMYDRCKCCIAARVSKPATLHQRHEAASTNELATDLSPASGRALAIGLDMLGAAMRRPPEPAVFVGNESKNRPENEAARRLRD